jgi:hypothetical protein
MLGMHALSLVEGFPINISVPHSLYLATSPPILYQSFFHQSRQKNTPFPENETSTKGKRRKKERKKESVKEMKDK